MRLASLLLLLMMSASASGSALAGAGDDGDAVALLAFKAAAVGGGGRDVLASWNASGGPCGWEGVTCGRHRRVVALSLPSLGLAGMLSPAVGNLSFLRALNLSLNWLHGGIPASIGRLRRLRDLDLSFNTFSGELPSNLTSCVGLTSLDLGSNYGLTGLVPADLGDAMARLQLLHLDNNSFTGAIPGSLSNLTALRSLNLRMNSFSGEMPPAFGSKAPGLTIVDVCQNKLQGALPLFMHKYNLSSLEKLGLGNNMLSGSLPADIDERLPLISYLGMFNNRFSGAIPSSISNLTALASLQLGMNGFTGSVPRDLGRTGALRDLLLGANKLEAPGETGHGWAFMASLTNCSQLRSLYLGSNNFTGQLPSSVVNLSSTTLRELSFADIRVSGSIPRDIGNLAGLKVLEVVDTPMSGVIPESIGKLGNLTELDLSNNSLSGLIPSSMGNLNKLIKLFVQSNRLEGPIPASLGKLSSLNVLDLSGNHLNGSISREILELTSLNWYLNLSHNFLSGPLPSEVGSLASLNSLSLSGNMLSGQIPSSIRNCIVLEVLLLDNNSFQGNIPESLEGIKGLRVLDLGMNKLSGRIPDTLGRIHNLQELYLAYNNLSGPIPEVLQNLKALSKLDISFNDLRGGVPKEGVFRNLASLAIAGNNELCGGIPQLHLAPCPLPKKMKKVWSKSLRIAVAITGAIFFLALVIALIHFVYKKLRQQTHKSQSLTPVMKEQFERVSYQALANGTNGFSDDNLIGKGEYGTVYKCALHDEGTVAVKVFNLEQSGSTRSFVAECEALRTVRHRCLIKIITCCSSINNQGQEFKALVFEFMPNGSLDGWLHPKSGMPNISNTLNFAQRIDIAVDIMDALDYLHNQCQPPIIHCDLKPSNILLAEDMSAQVGDFGISRILPEGPIKTLKNSNSTIGIRGSIGYVAPEYAEGSPISTFGDVYSLGILLLEIFTGRSPTDDMFRDSLDLRKFSESALPDRISEIADPTIWEHADAYDSITRSVIQKCLISVIELGISCSKKQPRERMPIQDAAMEMHSIRDAYLMFVNFVKMECEKEREVTIELQ